MVWTTLSLDNVHVTRIATTLSNDEMKHVKEGLDEHKLTLNINTKVDVKVAVTNQNEW